MRCLYCGKHLPLLRKLTGGEFCSDAHRDSYHEEYNRLAVSRLLQAQSRPDEPKVAAKAPGVEHGTTVAVAEEPEVEISGTFLDEFQVFTISPALTRAAQFEIEIEPAFE